MGSLLAMDGQHVKAEPWYLDNSSDQFKRRGQRSRAPGQKIFKGKKFSGYFTGFTEIATYHILTKYVTSWPHS